MQSHKWVFQQTDHCESNAPCQIGSSSLSLSLSLSIYIYLYICMYIYIYIYIYVQHIQLYHIKLLLHIAHCTVPGRGIFTMTQSCYPWIDRTLLSVSRMGLGGAPRDRPPMDPRLIPTKTNKRPRCTPILTVVAGSVFEFCTEP